MMTASAAAYPQQVQPLIGLPVAYRATCASSSAMRPNNIIDNIEQCWQQNTVHCRVEQS